jgi:hypothetical protein
MVELFEQEHGDELRLAREAFGVALGLMFAAEFGELGAGKKVETFTEDAGCLYNDGVHLLTRAEGLLAKEDIFIQELFWTTVAPIFS